MSQRERRNRKDAAQAAIERFGELTRLMREKAELQVCGPLLLADAESMAEANVDPAELRAWVQRRLAVLAEAIDDYRADPGVAVLAEAALSVGL